MFSFPRNGGLEPGLGDLNLCLLRVTPFAAASRCSPLALAGVIILTVSGGDQSQKMRLFPFNPPLNGGDFDHCKMGMGENFTGGLQV